MQNYRDPPPYPGHSKQVFPNQPGFRQSFSGSEASTDVSVSSTENLATSQRQEPQGEETQAPFYHNPHQYYYNHQHVDSSDGNSSYSILARLGMPPAGLDSSVGGKTFGSSLQRQQQTQLPQYHNEPGHQQHSRGHSNMVVGHCHVTTTGGHGVNDSLYRHGNQLTVPQWKFCDLVSGNSYSHPPYHDSPSSKLSSGVFIQRGIESTSSSSSLFTSSAFSQSMSSSISTSFPSSKTIDLLTPSIGMVSSISTVTAAATSASPSMQSSNTTSSGQTVSSFGYSPHQPHRMADYATSNNPPPPSHPYLSPRVPPVSTFHHPHPYVNAQYLTGGDDAGATSTTPTPNHGDGTTPNPSHLPPPPKYPGMTLPHEKPSSSLFGSADNIRTCRSYEAIVDKMDKLMDVSLTHHSDIRLCASSPGIYIPHHSRSPVRSANASSDDGSDLLTAAKASRMVDVLTEENGSLREELAIAAIKVSRLSKFEMEVQKMHEAHQALLESHQKRETLWLAMRRKLEERIQSLEASPTAAPNSLEDSDISNVASLTDSDLRSRLLEKESIITRLLSQNQELMASRKQLETENIQLNVTLAEQTAHVEIVEKVLVNCQAKFLMGNEESQKKMLGEVSTRSCSPFLRSSSEMIQDKQHSGVVGDSELREESRENLTGWKLGDEISGLKQTYLKDSKAAICIDEASQPLKEVRLAALEKNASDVEKLIDEAKTEKLKHMEELHESNKKMAELEAKVKQLQTQLVEKEAMVKVFQRSPYSILPRSSSLHALCHQSPLHSPRPSLIATQAVEGIGSSFMSPVTGGSHREYSSIRHLKSGSTSAIEKCRKLSMEEDLLSKVQSLGNCQSKDDSTEEVRLWHV